MRGDEQVVMVPFASYAVEVVPAFLLDSGQYWVCNTHDGGKYLRFDPNAEAKNVADSESATNGNTRHLIRMLKDWQGYCSVLIKSFHLELLAIQFLASWQQSGRGHEGLTDPRALRPVVERSARAAALACTRAGAQPPTAAELG